MSAKQHVVRLTPEQRGELKALLRRNATTALEQRRARILLQTDDGRPGPKQTDAAVAAAVGVDRRTVARVRAVFATAGFAVALHGQRRLQQTPPKLDSSQEARLVALACMDAPGGHAHWTLRLLAGRAVELAIVDQLSHETVRKTLKKKLKPWRVERWVIPPEQNAAVVAAMEDVLAVYARPADPRRPLVCFDEGGKELRAATRPDQAPAPGRAAREDTEYVRHGSANLFLAVVPRQGWRNVTVTEQRTSRDFAHALRALLDGPCADADGIVLVTDNLNTHRPAAFYQTFPAAEARRLVERIEWHFTPLHGSWLNMAELELSVLARQCLNRRLPDRVALAQAVAAWTGERNATRVPIDWRFTIADARATLSRLYPAISP